MTDGQKVIDFSLIELERLEKFLPGLKTVQIRTTEPKQIIKATAHAWFNNHRPIIATYLDESDITPIDNLYRGLLTASTRATLRKKYLIVVNDARKRLGNLQAEHALALSKGSPERPAVTSDVPPKFGPLVTDTRMQSILTKRWQECSICVQSKAPLAATVMMGGLLEGLLLAKINQLSDKSMVFNATAAPKDVKTGKTLQLKEWGLKNYIDVAHELGWISKTTKDIGEVVRDYRNYIHPQKEFSHGISLESGDAQMLWEVAKSITLQLLKP